MTAVRAHMTLLEPGLYAARVKQMPAGQLKDLILALQDFNADRATLFEAASLRHQVCLILPGRCLWDISVPFLLQEGLRVDPGGYRISELPLPLSE